MQRARASGAAAAVIGALLVTTGCTDMAGSWHVDVVNESDRPLMVHVDGSGWDGVAPRSIGSIQNSWGLPDPAWTIAVYDASCRVLARLPIPGRESLVRVEEDGSVSVVQGRRPLELEKVLAPHWRDAPTDTCD